jgi:hypothetical protein
LSTPVRPRACTLVPTRNLYFFCTNKKTPEESSTAELKESPGIEKGNRTVHAHMQYEADDPPVSK